MAEQRLSVGILASSPEMHECLARQVEAAQLASIGAVADVRAPVDDTSLKQFTDARPDIVLVDLHDRKPGIKALTALRAALPESWFLACGGGDTQLIIEAMQAGAREFFSGPVSPDRLIPAFSRCLEEKHRLRTTRKPRGAIYSVTSAKGGSGATSVAINLAAALAKVPEAHVALVDLSPPAGDAACFLDAKLRFSVSDALDAALAPNPAPIESFMTGAGGFSLLAGLESWSTDRAADPAALIKLLRLVSESYTHTFIDVPSGLGGGLLQAVINVSTALFVVLTPDLPSVWHAHRFLAFLAEARCGRKLRLVLNRADSRDYISARKIARVLNHAIYWRLPNDYGTAADAIIDGRPVVEANASRLASGYRRLVEDLTGMVLPKERRDLLRLFSRKGRSKRLLTLDLASAPAPSPKKLASGE